MVISIHAPREGGDYAHTRYNRGVKDFNPRPPRGGRQSASKIYALPGIFQSTPPARGATEDAARRAAAEIFQSTPPARGATYANEAYKTAGLFQSTPPARGATPEVRRSAGGMPISIPAPREGGDFIPGGTGQAVTTFQSTPPARGATAKMHSFTCGSLTNK